MKPRHIYILPALLAACLAALPALAQQAKPQSVAMLVMDADSWLVDQAFAGLKLPVRITARFFTRDDLGPGTEAATFIDSADVVIVDVMIPELVAYLLANHDPASKRTYALRGSRDDANLKRRGMLFDPEIQRYFSHLSTANIRNLVRCVIHREIDPAVTFQPVAEMAELGIYHPEAPQIFATYAAYRRWRNSAGTKDRVRPRIGLTLFSANLIEGQRAPYDHLIRSLEKSGLEVMACFGRDLAVVTRYLLDAKRRSRVELVLSFSLKFYSAVDSRLRHALADLDVPVLNAVNIYSGTIDQWRADPVGIPMNDVVWAVAVPEMSAATEPTPLSGKVKVTGSRPGKTVYVCRSIPETVALVTRRIHGWLRLKQTPNEKKKVAILYYNHSQGKQNIGASYLNVFRSLEQILGRLRRAGYRPGEPGAGSEADIKTSILRSGRNIGSWAPGELDRLTASGEVIAIPVATYRSWFDELPEAFRSAVVAQWGTPEQAEIMVHNGHIIVPAVIRENLVLLPEPARGWADAPMKLYHDATLYPHHQYIAAYLWLKKGFKAHAMIHLGTHATHEWLPGKQAGLAPADPPEVLLGDIPNLYPYIVDNIGEGLQAKRRGRGVVIDHLTPPLKKGGLYNEYAEISALIGRYRQLLAMESDTAVPTLERIAAIVRRTGLDTDLLSRGDHAAHDGAADDGRDHFLHGHAGAGHHHEPGHSHLHTGPDGRPVIDAAFVHELSHYLQEIRENLMPYGLHTFGVSPEKSARTDTAKAIADAHDLPSPAPAAAKLAASGQREMNALLAALEGRYVPPAEGNDPIRNIKAIPTGNNFFGFSPDKIPSPAAWELGQKAAEQIIARRLADTGAWPEKAAVVLWATETIRNEGVNESTILHLLGLTPVWDRTGRVTGTRVVPAGRLKRPRIDVLVNPSGLYRDLFPHMIRYIDAAIARAAAQTDITNLVTRNTHRIRARLEADGLAPEKAARLARLRIFTEPPGSYGTGVSELTSASGFWESDREIVDVYQNRVGYAFGGDHWGTPARQLFRAQLKDVDVACHSRSGNTYGLLDNDDMYQYLGGLSLAVTKERGTAPETLIIDQRRKDRVVVEDVARTLGRELRTRYLNPKWITGMQKENYAGAREMAKYVEYLWGWQVTTPAAVDAAKWRETYAVYVEDKYGLELKAFFNRHNPWAYQSLTARMLEAVRKKYWAADRDKQRKLAVDYAVNVVDKSVACCDHTCNNPLLNRMVVNIISVPGVLSPEIAEQFKMAIEKAMDNPFEKQVQDRRVLQERLEQSPARQKTDAARPEKTTRPAEAKPGSAPGRQAENVKGLKMEKMKKPDDSTALTTSGVQWYASVFVIFLIGLFVYGLHRNKHTDV